MMEPETWKTVISLVSAAVAVTSAVLAHRAKVQTRSDLFSSARNALQLAMHENDMHRRQLELRCGLLRAHLDRINKSRVAEDVAVSIEEFTAYLDGIEGIAATLDKRVYTEEEIDAMAYSEKMLEALRRVARREQGMAMTLEPGAYDPIFAEIGRFVDKYGVAR